MSDMTAARGDQTDPSPDTGESLIEARGDADLPPSRGAGGEESPTDAHGRPARRRSKDDRSPD
jgi:hypothetical protein